MAEEEKASGINPEFTELEEALEDIIERTQEVQEELAAENDKRGKIAEKERETAEDVRTRSVERLGETKARENAKKTNKSRSSSLEYFKEKPDKELDLKREEMELKKREMAMKEKESERVWEIKEQEIKIGTHCVHVVSL
jgi:hypothetical protein